MERLAVIVASGAVVAICATGCGGGTSAPLTAKQKTACTSVLRDMALYYNLRLDSEENEAVPKGSSYDIRESRQISSAIAPLNSADPIFRDGVSVADEIEAHRLTKATGNAFAHDCGVKP